MWDDDSNALGAARDLIGSATVFFKDIPPGQGLQDGEGLLPGRWVGAGGGGQSLEPTPTNASPPTRCHHSSVFERACWSVPLHVHAGTLSPRHIVGKCGLPYNMMARITSVLQLHPSANRLPRPRSASIPPQRLGGSTTLRGRPAVHRRGRADRTCGRQAPGAIHATKEMMQTLV